MLTLLSVDVCTVAHMGSLADCVLITLLRAMTYRQE